MAVISCPLQRSFNRSAIQAFQNRISDNTDFPRIAKILKIRPQVFETTRMKNNVIAPLPESDPHAVVIIGF